MPAVDVDVVDAALERVDAVLEALCAVTVSALSDEQLLAFTRGWRPAVDGSRWCSTV